MFNVFFDMCVFRVRPKTKKLPKLTEPHLNPARRRSSIGTFMRPHSSEGNHHAATKPVKAPPPKLDYRSMVSIDDMPELFVSFDSK